MTQDEIIELARQAGLHVTTDVNWMPIIGLKYVESFAKLVAEREREALTPRCWTQEMNDAWNKSLPDLVLAFDELIRARGQA